MLKKRKIILMLPSSIRYLVLKALFKFRSNLRLKSMKGYFNNLFFLYEVDGYFLPSYTINWYISYRQYENWVAKISAWGYTPKDGDTVLDIGAGIGEESIVFSKMVGLEGKVFAVEANPKVFQVLNDAVVFNKLANVKLIESAISTKNEKIILAESGDDFVSASVSNNKTDNNNMISVNGLRMDSLIIDYKIDKIDLLKVNIEGAERFVIDSIGELILKVRHVAISCHDFRFNRGEDDFFKTKDIIKSFLLENKFTLSFQNTGIDYIDDWVYGCNTQGK